MPDELYVIYPITSKPKTDTVTIDDLNKLIVGINKAFSEVAQLASRMQGKDAMTPTFQNDIEMEGHAINNVSKVTFSRRKRHHDFTGRYIVGTPAPTPASLQALRDDLTNNSLKKVETALNDLGTQVASILASVQV